MTASTAAPAAAVCAPRRIRSRSLVRSLALIGLASVAAYSTHSSPPSMASCDASGACALPSKSGKPAASSPVCGRVSYDLILDAEVQSVDAGANSGNPLPEGAVQKLRDFIPETGAVLFLVRRPG